MNPDENIRPSLPRLVPSENFQLRVFLTTKISDNLTSEDVKKMKYFCEDQNWLKRNVLEQINDGLDLFRHLEQLTFISNENLITLQAMLWHIKRRDLYKEVIEFCRNQDKTLHFVAASDQPVNGYKFVDLHIRGTQQYTLDDLRALRNELSYLLCCPPHHVLVNGIEPTNSIHITIMVPEDHVEFLFSIGEHEKSALHRLGVDSFKLDKKQIYCTEFERKEDIPSLEKDDEVRLILRQNKKLQLDLEHYQLAYEECYNNLKESQRFFLEYQRELKYAKELSDEEVVRLRNKIKEYQVTCRQLSQDLELISPKTPKQLRDVLVNQSIEDLQRLSCDYQSQLIVLLRSSSACETTSMIMKHLNDESLKILIQGKVNMDSFDDAYRVALNLKIVENMLSKRQTSRPRLTSQTSISDDEYNDE